MTSVNDLSCKPSEPAKALAIYREHGAVLVREVVSPDRVSAFVSAIVLLLKCRLEQANGSNLDELFSKLVAIDPRRGGELLMAARDTPAFFDVIFAPALRELVSVVSRQELLQTVPEMCQLRIDGPGQQDRLFEWHYDAAYTAMADSAVTCWLPMTAISHDMGPLKIIPGSHREVWKVRFRRDLAGQSFAGPKRIEMANPDIENFERRSIEVTPMQPGDTLLFHGRLLHCSGDNQSARYRWICNPRFGDLTDPKLVKQGWAVSRSRNPFAFGDYHPEQVSSDS